jgi:hypothetical protein
MPHAIVAGIPSPVARRIGAALEKVSPCDWTFSLFPGRDQKRASLEPRQVEALQQEAAQRGGAHVFAMTENRDNGPVAEQLRTYFRFRWLEPSMLRLVAQDEEAFIKQVQDVLKEETAWRARVMPDSKNSALVLPRRIFSCTAQSDVIWQLAEKYNDGPEAFSAFERHAHKFELSHRRKVRSYERSYWVDDNRRVWKDDGALHGVAPFPRGWKYSWALPVGFHFDVEHEQERAFTLRDHEGRQHEVKASKYVNIDAHGWVI